MARPTKIPMLGNNSRSRSWLFRIAYRNNILLQNLLRSMPKLKGKLPGLSRISTSTKGIEYITIPAIQKVVCTLNFWFFQNTNRAASVPNTSSSATTLRVGISRLNMYSYRLDDDQKHLWYRQAG